MAIVALLASALCGVMVALLWPGTFSLTAARFPIGGAVGPALAGGLAQAAQGPLQPLALLLPDDGGYGVRTALLLCAVIPALFAVTVWRFDRGSVPISHEAAV